MILYNVRAALLAACAFAVTGCSGGGTSGPLLLPTVGLSTITTELATERAGCAAQRAVSTPDVEATPTATPDDPVLAREC